MHSPESDKSMRSPNNSPIQTRLFGRELAHMQNSRNNFDLSADAYQNDVAAHNQQSTTGDATATGNSAIAGASVQDHNNSAAGESNIAPVNVQANGNTTGNSTENNRNAPVQFPVPARRVGNVRHAAPRIRGRQARDVHPNDPTKLWCTKASHWVSQHEFGDKNQCESCRRKARDARARHRARVQEITLEEQLANQMPQPEQQLPEPEPGPELPEMQAQNHNTDPLQQSALTPEQKNRLDAVREKIMNITLEECLHCHERWFDLGIKDGQCTKWQQVFLCE
jgi:hypothetical protein